MPLVEISIGTQYKSGIDFKAAGAIWTVTSLYMSCLKKYDSKKTRKVVIEITSEFPVDDLEHLLNVIVIKRNFNFEKYSTENDYSKKKHLLDVLQESLMIIAEKEKWDTTPLESAYDCCIEKKLEHRWLRKDKYFSSPDRKTLAGVICCWGMDYFEADAVFLNTEMLEIARVKLFQLEPWAVEPLGKMSWSKETNEFCLYSKDGMKRWCVKP